MNLAFLQAQSPADPSTWFVCLLGVSVVFVGLISLVFIVSLMNLFTAKFSRKTTKTVTENNTPASNTVIENKQEILAAVCAAVAEENGTDISAIRVLSFKKVN